MSTTEKVPSTNSANDKNDHVAGPTASSTTESSEPSSKMDASLQEYVAHCNWVPCPHKLNARKQDVSKQEASEEAADKDTSDVRARTLVLCFDGTGDQFDDDNSNVVQFLSCLKKDDEKEQLVYYQAGIGTYTRSAFVAPVTVKMSKVLDEMIAWNLSAHVQEGYEFLMQNYTAGDKICLFGFSRGAYTARALAGMVQKVGLLPRDNRAQIPFAWRMYIRGDEDGHRSSAEFKQTFSTDVVIDFLGVWDTVASVGIIGKELPFTSSNSAVRYFRHALALDEHRVKFLPNFYHYGEQKKPHPGETPPVATAGLNNPTTPLASEPNGASAAGNEQNSESQGQEASRTSESTELPKELEVWFAGCHCDVGGGSVRNRTRNSLARIPLRWMIRECFRTKTGIIFNRDMLKEKIGIDSDTLWPKVKERPERERAPGNKRISSRKHQKPPSLEVFSVVGDLAVIPVTVVAGVIMSPAKYLLHLVEFTPAGKRIRDKAKRGWSRVFGTQHGDRHTSRKFSKPFVSEEQEELEDALSPEYDRLSIAWFWWPLEVIPFRFRVQDGRRDDYFVRLNLGRGRKVYGDGKRGGIKVHRSALTRMEAKDRKDRHYRPRAWFKHENAVNGRVSGDQWHREEPEYWQWVE